MMKTGGRGSPRDCHSSKRLLPQSAKHRDRRVRIFQNRFGLGLARFPPRSAGVSLGRIHRQMLKYPGISAPVVSRTASCGIFTSPDSIASVSAEIADHPWERPIGVLSDAAEEIGRCRQVDAEVDAAQLVDAVQSLDPDRRFLEIFLGFLVLAEDIRFILLRLFGV